MLPALAKASITTFEQLQHNVYFTIFLVWNNDWQQGNFWEGSVKNEDHLQADRNPLAGACQRRWFIAKAIIDKAELSSLSARTKLMPLWYNNQEDNRSSTPVDASLS
jgi:hypothetical protein